MMMTIKTKGRSSGIGSMLKSLCLGMLLVAGLGFLNSIQAQTPVFLGDDAAKQITIDIQEEINSLEIEMQNPPSGVKSEWNEHLMLSYNQVSKGFTDGGSLQTQMLTMLEGSLFSSSVSRIASASNAPVFNLTPSQKQHLNSIIQHVENWNLTSRDLSDFEETLTLIRELKNL